MVGNKENERPSQTIELYRRRKHVRCVPLAATEEDERVLTWVREADRA